MVSVFFCLMIVNAINQTNGSKWFECEKSPVSLTTHCQQSADKRCLVFFSCFFSSALIMYDRFFLNLTILFFLSFFSFLFFLFFFFFNHVIIFMILAILRLVRISCLRKSLLQVHGVYKKIMDFHHSDNSDYCFHLHCYTYNVSADMSFDFLQVFHVKLRSLLRTSNWTVYLIQGEDCSNSVNNDRIQVLNYKYSLLFNWRWSSKLEVGGGSAEYTDCTSAEG